MTTANRQTRRAAKSKARKGKTRKVVPIKAQQGLALTDNERLTMENLTLKLSLAYQQMKAEQAPLLAQREHVGQEIGKRLGVEIGAYNINLDNGLLEPQNGGPSDPGDIPQPNQTTDEDPADPPTDETPGDDEEISDDGSS